MLDNRKNEKWEGFVYNGDMVNDSILKKVLQGLGNIAEETGKEALKQTGEIGHEIITGKQLLGNISTMSEGEYARKSAEEEKKKQDEIEKLKAEAGMARGRDVEAEMKEIEDEEEQKKKEEERRILAEVEARRRREREEREAMMAAEEGGKKRPQQNKTRGGAFAHKKKSDPTAAMMSSTSEFSGGKVD